MLSIAVCARKCEWTRTQSNSIGRDDWIGVTSDQEKLKLRVEIHSLLTHLYQEARTLCAG